MASAYGLRTRLHRFNWNHTDLGLGGRAYDSDDESKHGGLARLHAAPPTDEERAAAAVGLDAGYPSRAERRAFPDLLNRRAGAVEYLLVRCAAAAARCPRSASASALLPLLARALAPNPRPAPARSRARAATSCCLPGRRT